MLNKRYRCISSLGMTNLDGSQFKVETHSSHPSEFFINSALASCLIQTKGKLTNARLETGFPSVQLISNSNQYWRIMTLIYPDGLMIFIEGYSEGNVNLLTPKIYFKLKIYSI